MRTKTLFLAAAALAAGLASSQAQSNVYSVNIVGYINVPLGTTKALLSNPLNNGTNDLISIDNNAIPNKSVVNVWNGTAFVPSLKTSGTWGTDLSIPQGTAFFITPKTACTLTFVGSAPTSNNYSLGTLKSMIGAVIPMDGTLNDTGPNTINLGGSLPNKSVVNTWNGTAYVPSLKTSGTWSANLTIPIANGFFVTPKTATTWTQGLQ
jgi:hypothetical protein